MLHVLTGLIPPDAGSVFIHDLPIEDKASRACLGFAPDDLPLPTVLTGLEYLDLHDALRSRRDHERARVLAHVLGIDGALGRQIAEYSHGMKRKIQLVAALMHRPQLLVLDEPFRGLDPDTASVLRELVACFVGSERAVLVATHDMLRAERDCDVVTILDRGRVVVSGAPTELISDVPGAKSLEDVFLQLTGRYHEIDPSFASDRESFPNEGVTLVKDITQLIISLFAGIVTGMAVLFIGLTAAVSYAYLSGGQVYLPGILRAWFSVENDAPALNFEPNGAGMAVVVLVVALSCVAVAVRSGRRSGGVTRPRS